MKPWSVSANGSFRKCQRQYFFGSIMASHNARDPVRREAHLLKQLSGLAEWRGKLVHHAMQHFFVPGLKQGVVPSQQRLLDQTVGLARDQYSFSEQRRYKENGLTKTAAGASFLALREHEYGVPIQPGQVEEVLEAVRQCYVFLYSKLEFLDGLRRAPWHSPELTITFRVGDDAVRGMLDLAMGGRNGSSKITIVDWKIGHSETSDYSRQLRVYALAALARWKDRRVEDLSLVEANLLQGKVIVHPVTERELLDVEDFIYRSVSEMRRVADNPQYTLEDLENYDVARSPRSCEHCRFLRLCERLSA